MTVYALPEITLTFPDAIYTDAGMIQFAGYATPTGGKFYLDGQNKTFFNAATVGVGEHTLRYVVKNSNNCEAEQTMTFTVSERPKYTITFVDDDGITVLQQSEVALDAMPTPPADPTKEATAEFTYTFAGWQPEIVAVTGVATYIATYNAMTNPTALPANEQLPCPTKIIDNGLLYILLPDGTRFSATGVKVE